VTEPSFEIKGSVDGITLQQRLSAVPKYMRPEIRRALKDTADDVKREASANASWSTRIPRSLTTRVAFQRNREAIRVVARRRIAPHAGAYEGKRGQGSFAHPLFGNRSRWYEQRTRPFLVPALRTAGRQALKRATEAFDKAAARAGFRITS
jgi:hypothetical protein